MDTTLYQFEDTFDITLGLTKAQRLEINESAMTHAMVISGVHLDASFAHLCLKRASHLCLEFVDFTRPVEGKTTRYMGRIQTKAGTA